MKKLKEAREMHDFKNVWTSDFIFLRMNQEIQVYFMNNPDLVGNI